MKHFAIFLLLGLFLLIGGAGAGELEMTVVTNITGARADNLVALTTIIPGKSRILGFRITPYGAGCVDPYVELHDSATTAGMTTSTLFDALEADTAPLRSESSFYPKSKKISNGLCVRLGGYTAVTIFHEKFVP